MLRDFQVGSPSGHLRRQRQDELELTFAEIERILGALLPKSGAPATVVVERHRPHVQRKAWRDAGYDAFLLTGKDRVRFKRTR